MAKNKYVTEEEFDALKALTKHYSNAEIVSICTALGIKARSDTTLKEIRKADNFEAYQTRNAEPKMIMIINDTKIEGTYAECEEIIRKARKERRKG